MTGGLDLSTISPLTERRYSKLHHYQKYAELCT